MAEPPRIRVLVADDHQVVRVGLRTIIESQSGLEVVAEAGDGPGAVAAFKAHAPDITLLDLRMPGMSGPHVIAEIRRHSPGARILVVTNHDEEEDVFRAVQAGARGFLLKGTSSEGILEAIRQVHAGRRLIDPQIAARLLDRISEPSLTAREIGVLGLVARGLTNKEIGTALSMGEETVKAHLKHVFAKLDVTDRTEAALSAIQRGLLPL